MAAPERVVSFRPRTILAVLGVILLFALVLALVYLAWRVITWILIAAFLAAALNPAVQFFERRGVRRGLAAGLVFFLALGAVAALGVTRVLGSALYGVSTTDPTTFAAVAALLVAVGLLATYIPARRATRVDPARALQEG